MQLTDWILVEMALLLIGMIKISQPKFGFDHPSSIESPLRLRAQSARPKFEPEDC
jgi:hypothetical protein